MQPRIGFAVGITLLAIAAFQGCSENTRESVTEDVNDGARQVDNAVEDAVD